MAKTGRPRGNGVTRPVQRSRVALAAILRDTFSPELVRDWYMMLLSGKKPIIVADARCTGGFMVMESPGGYTPPTLDQMMTAMARIHERAEGMPAQHVHLEAELKAEITAIGTGLPSPKELPDHVQEAIRKAIHGMKAPKQLPPPSIDVEFAEVVPITSDVVPVPVVADDKV